MKISAIQYHATGHKQDNIAKAVQLTKQAARAGAKMIVLPECFNVRSEQLKSNDIGFVAENIPGPSTKPFLKVAKDSRLFVVLGSLLEKTKLFDKAYNTSVVVSPDGKILAKYRKKNLFRATVNGKKINEQAKIIAGKKIAVAKIANMTVGLSICYDLRFPEIYAQCRKQGAHVLFVPSCFTKKTGEAHWEILLRARAIENMCYVVAPNQTGKTAQGIALYGNSMIVDPWGKVLARASGNKEEILYADIDLKKIKQLRKRFSDFQR